MQAQAEQVLGLMAGIRGIVDPRIEFPIVEPTIEIQVDLAAAEPYRIKPSDVRRAAAVVLSGIQVGSLFEDQKVFEVVVWSTPETRSSLTSISELLIDAPTSPTYIIQPLDNLTAICRNQRPATPTAQCISEIERLNGLADASQIKVGQTLFLAGVGTETSSSTGGFVSLGDVADIRIAPNPTVVKREAVSRYIDLTADVSGRGISSIESEIDKKLKELNFPIEYHAEVVGEKTAEGRLVRSELTPYVLVAAIGIYLLLQAAFVSWRLATLSFLILPAALVGGIIAAVIDGGDVTIGSYAGFLALLGISVHNGLALYGRYLQIEREEDAESRSTVVLRGAQDRLAPVLMTALAAALALLSPVIAGEIAGFEVIRPLAVVVMGGLVTSTLLSLFVMPLLYLQLGPKSVPKSISL